MLIGLGRGTRKANRELTSVTSILPNAIFDFSTQAFSGGQVWKNLATGSNFFLGDDGTVNTTDPTWDGANKKFTTDGGDYFTLDGSYAGTFLETMHDQANTGWAIGMAFKMPTSLTNNNVLWGNNDFGAGATGVSCFVQSSGRILLLIAENGADATPAITSTGALVAGNTYLLVIAGDPANTEAKVAINSTSFGSPTTSIGFYTGGVGATDFFNILAGAKAFITESGAEVYEFFGTAGYLSDAQMASIHAFYEARTGMTFA